MLRLYCFILLCFSVGWTSSPERRIALSAPPGLCPNGQGFNAFLNGDFGSGTDNILQTDPGIAPGYMYSVTPPPLDGFYTITNNTTLWGSFASAWIDIGDNSPDPNGYMLVVNASFEPGIFFRQTVNVCEGSTYQFSADIINLLEPTGPQEIRPNVDFLVDGAVFFSTGDIPQNGLWESVGFTFTTTPGQTTATLEIRNNAPGGQGNDLALDNIAFFACGPLISIDVDPITCSNVPFNLQANLTGGEYNDPFFQWQSSPDGVIWTDIIGANSASLTENITSTTFYRVYVSDGAANITEPTCRILSTVQIVTIIDPIAADTIELCDGDTIQVGNELISAGGNFDIVLQTQNGCDSFLNLQVDIIQPSAVTIFDSICSGEFYLGQQYFSSTMVEDILVNQVGCDSVITINLFVDAIDLILPADVSIAQGETYTIVPSASGNVVQWNWTPDIDLSCNDCPVTDASPLLSTRYYLEAISALNCTDSASILITVILDQDIYMPNAFSPNNDGINDLFYPLTHPNINSMRTFKIFDRWGAVVFERSNASAPFITSAWDGSFKGKPLNDGVYAYYVEFNLIDNSIIATSGDILLVR